MFRWLNKRRAARRAAYTLGQEMAQTIRLQIDKGIDDRVVPASERFMDVLRDLVTEIMEGDEPSLAELHDARIGFEENLDVFIDTMHSELSIILVGSWDETLETIGVDRKLFDPYIELKLAQIKSDMQETEATILLGAAEKLNQAAATP